MFKLFTLFCSISLLSTAAFAAQFTVNDHDKFVIGYVFPSDNRLDPDSIAAEKMTHINYAFSTIEHGKLVEGFAFDRDNYMALQRLKKRNPQLKILTSVGGWTWSGAFSEMVLTQSSRQVFIESAVAFVTRHQLDGIDIDWEYPGLAGAGNPHRAEDGRNFTLLLKDLRQALTQLSTQLQRPILLTIASGGFPAYIAKSDIANWHPYLDFINIMAYDFNFPADGAITGHHAALYSNPQDRSGLSADAAVQDHVAAGVPASKLVIGVAFYGRSWFNVTTKERGLYQQGYTGETDLGGSYHDLVTKLIDKQGFERHWDPIAKAPWLWHAKRQIFISYDDPESISAKSQYVKQQGLRGIMFWQYNSDHKNELLDSINQSLAAPVPTPATADH
nr:glycoside hydrolase family 18 protein [Rheinheimera soli]